MKLLHALFVGWICIATATAQNPPPASPPAPGPVETVQPAIPASTFPEQSLPDNASPSFTQDEIRQIETALKKQMMLVGMGSGVVGLLLGMMIGRKTAPRPTGRRF